MEEEYASCFRIERRQNGRRSGGKVKRMDGVECRERRKEWIESGTFECGSRRRRRRRSEDKVHDENFNADSLLFCAFAFAEKPDRLL